MNFNASATSNLSSHGGECQHGFGDVLKYLLFGVIFVISLCGNGFVCWVVWRHQRMRTVMNYFLVNLAIDDLAFTLVCIPFDLPVQINQCLWPYLEAFCRVLFPLQTMCSFASVFTLILIGFSRYKAIVHPMGSQMELAASKRFILFIWIISFLFVIPYILVLEVDTSTLQCVEAWPGPRGLYGGLYSYFIFITGFALPLTVLFGCYLKICLELRRNSASNQNHALRADHDREAEKVLKMSIVVTVVFSVCTLPNHIVWLALDFDELNCAQCHPWLIVANIFVFANSAANPVVCTIFNEKYRCEFKKLFKRKRKRDRNERGHNKGTALEEQL